MSASSIASTLSEQGFRGPSISDTIREAFWAVFHRSIYLCIPQTFSLEISLNEIARCLIQQRQGQDLKLLPLALQRLGDPRFDHEIGILERERGKSQEHDPTANIETSWNNVIHTEQSLLVQTSSNIMIPNPLKIHSSRYEGLSASTIMLGRVIEDLDCPSRTYYDSEVASLLEGDIWGVGSAWQSLCLFGLTNSVHYSPKAGEPRGGRLLLTTEGIKTYRSILSINDTVPEFLEHSEKKDLAKWVSQRKAGKAAYIITAYQTHVNAIIEYWRTGKRLERLFLKSPGLRQTANQEEEGKCSHHHEVTMNL